MNFIGHAAIARWTRQEPAFLFGAMLPDFAHMAGAAPVVARAVAHDALVAEGVAHHHATDAAFHGAPAFISLCVSAVDALSSAGVRRGPARALAHVGTELVLDGLLLADDTLAAAYVESIAWASDKELATSLALSDADGARLDALARRLSTWGAPYDYRRADFVAERLAIILEARPRLAVLEHERALIAPFVAAHAPLVAAHADALVDEVRQRLRAPQEA